MRRIFVRDIDACTHARPKRQAHARGIGIADVVGEAITTSSNRSTRTDRYPDPDDLTGTSTARDERTFLSHIGPLSRADDELRGRP